MRNVFLATSLVLILAACKSEPTPPVEVELVTDAAIVESAVETPTTPIDETVYKYEENWSINNYWPGEYPRGFTALYEGVVEPVRAQMHPDAPKITTCAFDQGTAYHPWSIHPKEDGSWDFFSAAEQLDLVVKKPFKAYVDYHENPEIIPKDRWFDEGDVLRYQSYVGEGFSLFIYKGKEVLIDEAEILDNVTLPEKKRTSEYSDSLANYSDTHLWMKLDCGSAGEGFVLLSELKNNPNFFVGIDPFVAGYGVPKTPNEDEIIALRKTKEAAIENADAPQEVEREIFEYGEDWAVDEFWPGEYPVGVTALLEGDGLSLRVQMHPDAPKVKDCWLGQGIAYHPWNTENPEKDEWKFFSASQKAKLTVVKPFTARLDFADRETPSREHEFSAGDEIIFLGYIAEGLSSFEVNGEVVQLHEGTLGDNVKWPEKNPETGSIGETHLWLNVPCGGRGDGFIWLRELKDNPSFYVGVSPFVKSYGVAKDLTREEIVALRDQK